MLQSQKYLRGSFSEFPKLCDEKGNIEPARLDYLMPWLESLPEGKNAGDHAAHNSGVKFSVERMV